MESLTHESEQIKEVFAPFGLAIYQAQCLERSLAMAVATVYGPGPQKLTKSGYEKLLQSNFKRTLGRLIAELQESVVVDGDLGGWVTGPPTYNP